MLLGFEAIHINRQLGRCDDIGKEDEFPSGKLRAITQVEIFRERIVLPASCFFDARPPPQARSAIEIEEAAAAAARGLLEEQMPIEEHCLHLREQRIGAIQMTPACLDHPDLRIGKMMD